MDRQMVLFGGTFDPVHHGHLIVARALAERCGFERVSFVPAGRPPHKRPDCAAAEHRLQMLRLAIAGEKIFDVCDIELSRSGPSYTVDTLVELRRRCGRDAALHWVIGADMLEDLPNWRDAEGVLGMARIVVAARPPWNRRMDRILAGLRDRLGAEHAQRLGRAVVQTPLIDISSSQIRRRLQTGMSIRYLIPERVAAYLRKHRLYA